MRFIIVSNRLPYKVSRTGGGLELKPTAGGLAIGMMSYLSAIGKQDYVWVGWPGAIFENPDEQREVEEKTQEANSVPVFMDEATVNGFYNGFCNRTLYPLFGYFTSYVKYNDDYWKMYKKANKMFAEKIASIVKPGDIVWIHDYHFMLLPRMLREANVDVPIGFFLHIPFPAYEVFRLLPTSWGNELLEGVLSCNLIGFHTYDYTQDFLTSVSRILGYDNDLGYIHTNDHVVHADTFPMGIEYSRFSKEAESQEVVEEGLRIREQLQDRKILFSIDRLDYTKGLFNRLEGYEIFLHKHPELHGKVAMVLVVVPSRDEIREYKEMKVGIENLVGRINGRFGNVGWTPVIYQYRFIDAVQLVAFYKTADIALITPLRDGMNLVAKEYVASKGSSAGVLVLSDMAGAAKELSEAVITNPNHPAEIADAIEKAVEMPVDEQLRRMHSMQLRVKSYDIVRWGTDFVNELVEMATWQDRLSAKLLGRAEEELLALYKDAPQSLLLLDYDGTLIPFSRNPRQVLPDGRLRRILQILTENPRNEVVVISGRDRDFMEKAFEGLRVNLVAEHGALIRPAGEQWTLLRSVSTDWKKEILPILEDYVDRLPGARIEEKEYSIVWHYREAESEFASIRIKELSDSLIKLTANSDVNVYKGNKIIEIKNAGINKGAASMYFIEKINPQFILAIGDDYTDEDMFRSLPETAFSLKVGIGQSYARFNLRNIGEVLKLLERLTDADKEKIRS